MNVGQAIGYVRFILGDNSESVWADTDIIGALNVSNRRIMARIVEQNPEQYIMSYEDYLAFQDGHTGAAPISIPAGSEGISIQASLEAAWAAEGQTNGLLTANPIKLMRLFYSNSAGLANRIEIPLVPFSALDERTEQNTLEYEVLSQTQYGAKYKASYSAGTTLLQVRPIPAKTMYLKIYWAEAGVAEIDPDTSFARYMSDIGQAPSYGVDYAGLRARAGLAAQAARTPVSSAGAFANDPIMQQYYGTFGGNAEDAYALQEQVATMLAQQRPGGGAYRGRMGEAIQRAMVDMSRSRLSSGAPQSDFLSWYLGQTEPEAEKLDASDKRLKYEYEE